MSITAIAETIITNVVASGSTIFDATPRTAVFVHTVVLLSWAHGGRSSIASRALRCIVAPLLLSHWQFAVIEVEIRGREILVNTND